MRNIGDTESGQGGVFQSQIQAVHSRDRQAWQANVMWLKHGRALQRVGQIWACQGPQEGAQGKGVLGAQNFTAALCGYKVNPAGSVTAIGMRET